MPLFDGLYFYEIVLLVCGVVFFIALLVALLWMVFSNKNYKGLLPFFVLPIAMIGYTSIQSIQIQKGVVSLNLDTKSLLSNPGNPSARAALQTEVSGIQSRPIGDPTALATLAKAQYALGDDNQAESNVAAALKSAPTLPAAVDLKTKIDLVKTLKTQATTLKNDPNNAKAREGLQQTYNDLNKLQIANPKAQEAISSARTLLQQNVTQQ
jgi:hypothetical protein